MMMPQIAFGSDIGISLSYATPDIKIRNMPLEVRNVPIHPDDTYVSQKKAGPIEEKEYSSIGTIMFGPWIKKDIGKSRAGLRLNWIIYPGIEIADKELRNYTNAVGTEHRGHGAALTFVGIEKRGIFFTKTPVVDVLLNVTPEVFFEVNISNKKDNLQLGASVSYARLVADTGWDRFNSLETRELFTLAHIIPVSTYIKYNNYEFGVQVPIIFETSLGEKAKIETKTNFLIRFNY